MCIAYHTCKIEIETHIARGLPHYAVVGLPSAIIRESKERVRSALKSSGEIYPDDRITQSLFPAYEKKEGSQLDLPLAVGIYSAMHEIFTGDLVFLGELSLDGKIKTVQGMVNYILSFPSETMFVLPADAGKELENYGLALHAFYYSRLTDLFSDLKRGRLRPRGDGASTTATAESTAISSIPAADFSQVIGQNEAIRKLQIAAIGRFHTLMIGPPGCGKTMLSTRFPGILPSPGREEMIEIGRIYGNKMMGRRPIRNPHHSITRVGLIGGGNQVKIGEISKAHHGVLLLDEFGEYQRKIIELLREPLETGEINIARGGESVTLPAKFILVATMNPCFCGRYHPHSMDCSCDQNKLREYYAKLSWPLIDRMGILIELKKADLAGNHSKSSEDLKTEVENAISFGRELDYTKRVTKDFEFMLKEAYSGKNITMRSLHIAKEVAKCIADLEQSEMIKAEHLQEAMDMNPSENLKKYFN